MGLLSAMRSRKTDRMVSAYLKDSDERRRAEAAKPLKFEYAFKCLTPYREELTAMLKDGTYSREKLFALAESLSYVMNDIAECITNAAFFGHMFTGTVILPYDGLRPVSRESDFALYPKFSGDGTRTGLVQDYDKAIRPALDALKRLRSEDDIPEDEAHSLLVSILCSKIRIPALTGLYRMDKDLATTPDNFLIGAAGDIDCIRCATKDAVRASGAEYNKTLLKVWGEDFYDFMLEYLMRPEIQLGAFSGDAETYPGKGFDRYPVMTDRAMKQALFICASLASIMDVFRPDYGFEQRYHVFSDMLEETDEFKKYAFDDWGLLRTGPYAIRLIKKVDIPDGLEELAEFDMFKYHRKLMKDAESIPGKEFDGTYLDPGIARYDVKDHARAVREETGMLKKAQNKKEEKKLLKSIERHQSVILSYNAMGIE